MCNIESSSELNEEDIEIPIDADISGIDVPKTPESSSRRKSFSTDGNVVMYPFFYFYSMISLSPRKTFLLFLLVYIFVRFIWWISAAGRWWGRGNIEHSSGFLLYFLKRLVFSNKKYVFLPNGDVVYRGCAKSKFNSSGKLSVFHTF